MANTDEESYAVIGAAMEVFNELGSGFLESIYHRGLEKEFSARKIPFISEHELPVFYKCDEIGRYRVDFLCFDSLLVEIEALSRVGNNEKAQVINYLKASGLNRALLINFGAPSLEYKRVVLSRS